MVLKLTFNKHKPGDPPRTPNSNASSQQQQQQPPPPPPAAQSSQSSHTRPSPAPSNASGTAPKLKLKFGPAPSTPAASPAVPSKSKNAAGVAKSTPRATPKATPKAPSLKLKKPKAPPAEIGTGAASFKVPTPASGIPASATGTPTATAPSTLTSTSTPAPKSKKRPRAELKLSAPKKPIQPIAETATTTATTTVTLKKPTTLSVKPPARRPPAPQQIKRIRFNAKPPPAIRLKSKGEPPRRPKGVGYDSEASDAEIDPALEEEFILRMQPGEDCDYLRQAIEEKRFGPPSRGGADVSFKALTRDGRRSVVTIRGHIYAATLVDLPCIVEAMKSWDKRGWYKSADICQMLLVLGRVANEEEAKTYPLPKDIDSSSWQFAHGLTPPLRWVRKRRFRKRISNRTIETVELEVARLLKEDMDAVEPPEFEVLDYAQYMREEEEAAAAAAAAAAGETYGDVDAEGEIDYMDYETAGGTAAGDAGGDPFEDAFAAEMEAALAAHAEQSGEPEVTVEETTNTAAPTAPPVAGVQPAAGTAAGTTTTKTITAEPGQTQLAGEPMIKQEYETEEISDLFGDDEEGGLNLGAGSAAGTAPPTAAGTPNLAPSASAENESSSDNDDDDDEEDEDEDAYLDEATLERQRQMKEAQEECAELEARIAEETRRWEALTNPILKGKLGRSISTLKQELELKRVLVGQVKNG